MLLPAGTQPRLLVVEDDADILTIVQGVLEDEGYAVTPAMSLAAALALLDEHLYHYILTDLFAPQGNDLLQNMRPFVAQAAPISVGLMTGWSVTAEAVTQAGFAWLLRKPFELDDLVRVMQRHVPPSGSLDPQTQVVEHFFAALNAGDWKRLARLCTPEVVVKPLSAPPVATRTSLGGLLSYRPLLERRFLALPGYTIERVQVFARPVGVAARYLARWQSTDGVVHRVAGSMHFHVRGGRIAQIEGVF